MGAARRHAVLAAMYLAQGISYGFAGWILIPTLAAQGVSLSAQGGVLAAGGLPWVFKALWGILLDRGRAKKWGRPRWVLVVAQMALALSFAVLAAFDDVLREVTWLTYIWFGHNVALALQDVATDTLALDSLRPGERGRANALMLGSHHVGMEGVAAIGLGALVAAADLSIGLWVAAAIMSALALLPLTVSSSRPAAEDQRPALGLRLWQALSQPTVRRACLLAAVILLADNVTAAASSEFLVVHLGWTVDEVQARLPVLVLVASVLAYGAAAVAIDRIGHGRAVVVGCVGLGAVWAGFALCRPLWHDVGVIQLMVALQVCFTALLMAGVHAFLMDRTDPVVRSTQFVVFMALLNLPRWGGPLVAPDLLDGLGYGGLFMACGIFQLAVATLVPWVGAKAVSRGAESVTTYRR